MNKTYSIGQNYYPSDFEHKELFLAQRQGSLRQYRYQNAVSVYVINVSEVEGMYKVIGIARKYQQDPIERVSKLEAVLSDNDERRRSFL